MNKLLKLISVSIAILLCTTIPAWGTPILYKASSPLFFSSDLTITLPSQFHDKYPVIINSAYTILKQSSNAIGIKSIELIKINDDTKPLGWYKIQVIGNNIGITSQTDKGLIFGLNFIEKQYLEKKHFDFTYVEDRPGNSLKRITHLPVFVGGSLQDNFDLIDHIRLGNYDTVIIGTYHYIHSDTFPIFDEKYTKPKSELKAIIKYAKESGLEIIPQISLLTHQEYQFTKIKKYRLNKYTYNPHAEGIYDDVFRYIDEILQIFDNPKSIHIGHDEVYGTIPRLMLKDEPSLSAIDYLHDIQKITNYLRSKNIQDIFIWGDSLLDAQQFSFSDKHFHGNKSFADIVTLLPKEIIICDWHYDSPYQNFPSINFFTNKGFKVIASTWNNLSTTQNFVSYVVKQHNKNCIGLMTTTWYTNPKDKDKIINIIDKSAEIFWNTKATQ